MGGKHLPPRMASMTIRIPAATTGVKVESRATGNYIIFETQDAPVEIEVGGDMLRAIRIMRKCQRVLWKRGKCGQACEG